MEKKLKSPESVIKTLNSYFYVLARDKSLEEMIQNDKDKFNLYVEKYKSLVKPNDYSEDFKKVESVFNKLNLNLALNEYNQN